MVSKLIPRAPGNLRPSAARILGDVQQPVGESLVPGTAI
jgi:hypothetical protein